jgi:competence protein ComEC
MRPNPLELIKKGVFSTSSVWIAISVLFLFLAKDSDQIYFYALIVFSLIGLVLTLKTTKSVLVYAFICISIFIFIFINFQNPGEFVGESIKVCGYINNIDGKKLELTAPNINGYISTRKIYLTIPADSVNKFNFKQYQYLCAENVGGLKTYFTYNYSGIIKRSEDIRLDENIIADTLMDLDSYINQNLDKYFKDSSGLVKALVFGIKDDLDPEDKKDFSKLGISHLLVASGANIIIILFTIKKIFETLKLNLPHLYMMALEFVITSTYVLIVGVQGSLVRAFIFWAFINLESLIGRRISFTHKLLFTTVLLIFFLPEILFSLSFYLSMAAIMGIHFGDQFAKALKTKSEFIATLYVNISIILWTSLVTSYFFSQINLFGILTNLIFVPFVGILVSIGFVICVLILLLSLYSNQITFFLSELLANVFIAFIEALKGLVDFIESTKLYITFSFYFRLKIHEFLIIVLILLAVLFYLRFINYKTLILEAYKE